MTNTRETLEGEYNTMMYDFLEARKSGTRSWLFRAALTNIEAFADRHPEYVPRLQELKESNWK